MSDLRTHAKRYAPSASSRWTVCHASARFNEQFSSESSTFAMDGTEAHDLFAFAVTNKIDNAIEAKVLYPGVWTHREDEEYERLGSVQTAIDYVLRIKAAFDDAVVYVEQRVDFKTPLTDDCWGHSDVIVWIPSLRIIEIVDFKHGVGEVVEAVDNTQLGIYGASTYQYARDTLRVQPNMVVMTIVQPRAFHYLGAVRHWVVSDAYMDNVFIPEINGHIEQCEKPDAAFVPGKDQCKWCPGTFHCKAREAAALAAVPAALGSFQNVTKAALPPIANMPLDKLLWICNAAPLLRDYLNEAEKAIDNAARAGVPIPGKKLVEAYAVRKWYGNHMDVARELMKLIGTDDWDKVYPRELINVTEADKLVADAFKRNAPRGKKKEAEAIGAQALAHLMLKTQSGKITLVDENDKRPAINTHNPFTGITIIEPPKRIEQ